MSSDRYDRGIKIVHGFLRKMEMNFPAGIVEVIRAFCDYKYQIKGINRMGEEILRDGQVHKIYFRVNKEFDVKGLHFYVGICPTDGDTSRYDDDDYVGPNYNEYGYLDTGWGMFYFGTGTGFGNIKNGNIKPNDLIVMVVDLKRGYLKFRVEGIERGFSQDIDLCKKYKIAAWPADQVEIVSMAL